MEAATQVAERDYAEAARTARAARVEAARTAQAEAARTAQTEDPPSDLVRVSGEIGEMAPNGILTRSAIHGEPAFGGL